jgi:DNA-directed RNA polymerase alpha subunit/DNA-directed RNA polymerase subunit L
MTDFITDDTMNYANPGSTATTASVSINPVVSKNYEDEGILHFVVEDIPVCLANGIRRTIMSDIPIIAIRTETSSINQCQIETNTSRFHNEIIKQRLSCIPIISQDLEEFPQNYKLTVEAKNTSDYEMLWVTTDDFKVVHKESGQQLEKTELMKLFPHDVRSNRPIDFLRLRPMMGPTVPGEEIKLTAEFSIATASENGMFNAASKCAYFNVVDPEKKATRWSHILQSYKDEGRPQSEIDFEEKNFQFLDGQRCFKTNEHDEANSFEFVIKTIGQYTNYELVEKACLLIQSKIDQFQKGVHSDSVPMHFSDQSKDMGYTSVVSPNIESYDVILENEDYTLGYILEYFLYNLFYKPNNTLKNKPELTFVGFKKYHPHDDYSVIRLCSTRYSSNDNNSNVTYTKYYLNQACTEAIKVLEILRKKFLR